MLADVILNSDIKSMSKYDNHNCMTIIKPYIHNKCVGVIKLKLAYDADITID